MTRIRAGAGLGDSLYLQAIVRHLVEHGRADLEVCTPWPDLFRPLAGKVRLAAFSKLGVPLVAHYVTRKHAHGTDQFQDMCASAGVQEPVDLRLDWQVTDPGFVSRVRDEAAGRRILLVALPRNPMDRTDGFGAELSPDWSAVQAVIDAVAAQYFVVQVGRGKALHRLERIELDLANETTVAQLVDLASVAHAFLGPPSFMVPLAESFRRPVLAVFSRRGLSSRTRFIAAVTPEKVLHRPTSGHVVDDWPTERIVEAARQVFNVRGDPGQILR